MPASGSAKPQATPGRMAEPDTAARDPGGSVGALPRERFLALDSLRGVCAMLVALFHFHTIGLIGQSPFIHNSFLFVDFFFVLSGFVIAQSYRAKLADGLPVAKFILLRLGRVYPLHLAVLALFALTELAFLAYPRFSYRTPFTGEFGTAALGYAVLLVQIFAGPAEQGWNGPSWSIAAELWTYLLFALAARGGKRPLLLLCLVAALAAPGYIVMRVAPSIFLTHAGALARCVYGFALGVLGQAAFAARRRGRCFPGRHAATAAEGAVVIATILFVTLVGVGPLSLASPPFFLVVVLVFAAAEGAVGRLLTRPLPMLLGTLSYSIYMVHEFVQFRLVNLLLLAQRAIRPARPFVLVQGGDRIIAGGQLFADGASLGMLGLVIGLAALTYRLIERPGQRWSRRLVLGTRGARTMPAEERAPTF